MCVVMTKCTRLRSWQPSDRVLCGMRCTSRDAHGQSVRVPRTLINRAGSLCLVQPLSFGRRWLSQALGSSPVVRVAWHPTFLLRAGPTTGNSTSTPTPNTRTVRAVKRVVVREPDMHEAGVVDKSHNDASHQRGNHEPESASAPRSAPHDAPQTPFTSRRTSTHARAGRTQRYVPRHEREQARERPARRGYPVSPFDQTDTAAQKVTTASVVSYLLTLQRIHYSMRNSTSGQRCGYHAVSELLLALAQRLPSSPEASPTRWTSSTCGESFEWSAEMCEQALLTITLYGTVQSLPTTQAVTAVCVRRLLDEESRTRVNGSLAEDDIAAPAPVSAEFDLDLIARRARLASLLLKLKVQRDTEAVLVQDILAVYEQTDSAVLNTSPSSAPRDARDAYLFGVLLPFLYRQMQRLCGLPLHTTISGGRTDRSARDRRSTVPLRREEREVLSRVCQVLARVVRLNLATVHWDTATKTASIVFGVVSHPDVPSCPSSPSSLSGTGSASPCQSEDTCAMEAIRVEAFLHTVWRATLGILAEHHHGRKPSPRQELTADPFADQLMPETTTPGAVSTNIGASFRVDSVIPIVQLLLNRRAFSSLFCPSESNTDNDEDHAASRKRAYAAAATVSVCVRCLLDVLVQRRDTLMSFQLATVATCYSSLLRFTPSAVPCGDATRCECLQEAMLSDVQRGLCYPLTALDAMAPHSQSSPLCALPPGAVALALMQAAEARLNKYFASDVAALVSALSVMHSAAHAAQHTGGPSVPLSTTAVSSHSAAPEVNERRTETSGKPPVSRFSRKSGARTGPRTSSTTVATSSRVEAVQPPSSIEGSTALPFTWPAYDTARQQFTSQCLTLLAQRTHKSACEIWRVLLASPQAPLLVNAIHPSFITSWKPRAEHGIIHGGDGNNTLPSCEARALYAPVWLHVATPVMAIAGRPRDALGSRQQSTVLPHETFVLTSALACFPLAVPNGQASDKSGVTCRASQAHFPLISPAASKPYAWQALVDRLLTGPTKTYLGLFDHQGSASAQLIACRLGLRAPSARARGGRGEAFLDHFVFAVVATQHTTRTFSAADLVDTVSPFLPNGVFGASDGNAAQRLAHLVAELAQPSVSDTTLVGTYVSVSPHNLWRKSGFWSVADAFAVLLASLSHAGSWCPSMADVLQWRTMCLALWRRAQRLHQDALVSMAHARDGLTWTRCCWDLALNFVVPFFAVCRYVLQCKQMYSTSDDTPARATQEAQWQGFLAVYAVLELLVGALAMESRDLTHATHTTAKDGELKPHATALSESLESMLASSQPLWKMLTVGELLSLTRAGAAIDGEATSGSPVDPRCATLAPTEAPVRAFLDWFVFHSVATRSHEEVAQALATNASRQYRVSRAAMRVASEPGHAKQSVVSLQITQWLPTHLVQCLPLSRTFDAVSAAERCASLHFFTVLPLMLAHRGDIARSTAISTSGAALLDSPEAVIAALITRISTACATADALVYCIQQISLIDPALLTGHTLSTPLWDTDSARDAQGRLVATLYRHTARLLVEPLDALTATTETQGDGHNQDSNPLVSSDTLPYSAIDMLHFVVVLVEAEVAATHRCASRTLNTSHPHSSGPLADAQDCDDSRVSLLQAFLLLQQKSALSLWTHETVDAACRGTAESAALAELLSRALRSLDSIRSPTLRRTVMAWVALFVPPFMREYLMGTGQRGSGSHAQAHLATSAANDVFLLVVETFASVDSVMLTDMVQRALTPPAQPGPPSSSRHRVVRAKGPRFDRGVPHGVHDQLTALLTLTLRLFQHQREGGTGTVNGTHARAVLPLSAAESTAEDDMQASSAVGGRAETYQMRRLAMRLLGHSQGMLKAHGFTWACSSGFPERGQLLADLMAMPAVYTRPRFVRTALRVLLDMRTGQCDRCARLRFKVQYMPGKALPLISSSCQVPSPNAVLDRNCEQRVIDTPWLREYRRLSTVDTEAEACELHVGAVTIRANAGLAPVEPMRQSETNDFQLQLVARATAHTNQDVLFRSLTTSQQQQQAASFRRRPVLFGPVKLSLQAYQALLHIKTYLAMPPCAREWRSAETQHRNLLGFSRYDPLPLFVSMRNVELAALKQQFGALNFLSLATDFLEIYLCELSADMRLIYDDMTNQLDALDAPVTMSHDTAAREGASPGRSRDCLMTSTARVQRTEVCGLVERILAGFGVKVAPTDCRWASPALNRWLAAVADIVPAMVDPVSLHDLLRESVLQSGSEHVQCDAKFDRNHDTTPKETLEEAMSRGDVLEPASTEELAATRSATTTNAVDFRVLKRLLSCLESLCPVIGPPRDVAYVDGSVAVAETALSSPSPSPAALVLAATVRAALHTASAPHHGRSSPPLQMHGLSALLTFRCAEKTALMKQRDEAVEYLQYSFPLTRDHSACAGSADMATTVAAVIDRHMAVLDADRALVERALVKRFFPCLCSAAQSDAVPVEKSGVRSQLDRPPLERELRQAISVLSVSDIANAIQLLVRTAEAASPGIVSADVYAIYVTILCRILTELLPTLSGEGVVAVVRAVLPLLDCNRSGDGGGGDDGADETRTADSPSARLSSARTLQRGLAQLCAHIPPMIVHDMDRFTQRDLLDVVCLLHTPALFQQTDAPSGVPCSTQGGLFAHSFVAKEAALAIYTSLVNRLPARGSGGIAGLPADTRTEKGELEEDDSRGEDEEEVTCLAEASREGVPPNEVSAALEARWREIVQPALSRHQQAEQGVPHHDDALVPLSECIAVMHVVVQTSV